MKKKRLKRLLSLTLALLLTVSALPAFAADTDPQNWAWDEDTGRLAVDYEKFLSQHDLVYKALPTDGELQSMPVANGQTGAQVWQDDGIRMQIHSVDNGPHSAFAAAQVHLATNPTLDDSEGFEQRLHLYDGYISIEQNDGFTAEVFGLPDSETLGLHVTDTREDVSEVTFDVEVWPSTDSLTGSAGSIDNAAWKTVNYFEKDGIAGFTKGISTKEPFGYAFAVTVDGAEYTIVPSDDGLTAQIKISMPADGEYTIWMNASSRVHLEMDDIAYGYETGNYTSTAQDVFDEAVTALTAAKNAGYAAGMAAFKQWWNNYWARSFVHYNNGIDADSDYMENFYYLAQYHIGGAAFAEYQQMHFMNGVYSATKEDMQWNLGYWHWNQRAVYQGLLASNHADGYQSYLDGYEQMKDAMTTYTVNEHGEKTNLEHGFISDGVTDAMMTSETIRWDGNSGELDHIGQAGGWWGPDLRDAEWNYRSVYVRLIFSTGFELAENMYNTYKYTQDEVLLAKYYEFMRRTVRFIVEWAEWDGEYYRLKRSNAREIWWMVNNATDANAGIRGLIPKFLDAAKILGKETTDAELIAQAKDVLAKLEPIATVTENGKTRIADYNLDDDYSADWDGGIVQKNNFEQPSLETVYPHNLIGVDSDPEDLQMALNAYEVRSNNSGGALYCWCMDGIYQARLGLGNDADKQMGDMIKLKQKRTSGYTDDNNGEMEPMGLHISTMNEMLLQSYDDVIRVFPAVPDNFEGAFTLLASGGFLVSSEYANDAAKYIGIKSQYGGNATVKIPWAGEKVLVNGVETDVTDGRITISTSKNGIYLIQPLSAKDVVYTTVAYTGEANTGVKAAFKQTLGHDGIDRITDKVDVFYDFEDSIDDGYFTDSVNGNDAAVRNVTVQEVEGRGKVAVFNNQNSALEIPHSPTFSLMKDFEMSFDICTTDDQAQVFEKANSGASEGFDIYILGGKFNVRAGSAGTINCNSSLIADGAWHTVKVVVDTTNKQMTLFVDDEQQAQGTLPGPLKEVELSGLVGELRNGPNDWWSFSGSLDNLRIGPIKKVGAFAAYDFEDSIADGKFTDSLADNDAAINNVTVEEVEGRGKVAVFNGTNGWLEIPYGESFNPVENFEVSFDINTTAERSMMIYDRTNDSMGGMDILIYGDVLWIRTGGGELSCAKSKIGDSNWHSVKIVMDTENAKMTLFVDGEKEAEAALSGKLAELTTPGVIGQMRSGSSEYWNFKGSLDNFYIGPVTEKDQPAVKINVNAAYDFEDGTDDGKFTDILDNNDATINNVTVEEVEGRGKVAVFNGTNGWLEIPYGETFNPVENFEVSFDINTTAERNMAIYDRTTDSLEGLDILIYGDNLWVRTSVGELTCSKTKIGDSNWHSVRIVLDTENAKMMLYVDGQKEAEAAMTGKLAELTTPGIIGQMRSGSSEYWNFKGSLDNFYIGPIVPPAPIVNVSYDFEDATDDGYFTDSINGNDAAINNVTVEDVAGRGKVAVFNGTSGYLEIPHSNTFSMTEDFEMSFDICTTDGQAQIFNKTFGDCEGFDIYVLNGKFNVRTGAGSLDCDNSLIADGRWHTVKIVADTTNRQLALYLDGESITVKSLSGPLKEDQKVSGIIGQLRTGSSEYWNFGGSLDNFQIGPIGSTGVERVGVYAEYDFEDSIDDGKFTDILDDNDATINNVTVAEVEGRGKVAVFNGTNGWLEIPYSTTFNPVSNFEVSFDICTTPDRDNMMIFERRNATENGIDILIYGGNLLVRTDGGSLNCAKTKVADNTWHSVKIVLDNAGGKMTLLIDGTQEAEAVLTSALTELEISGIIGQLRAGSSEFWNFQGSLDNFRIAPIDTSVPAPEVEEIDFDDENIKYVGRWINEDDHAEGYWSGTYFEAAFTGSVIKVNLGEAIDWVYAVVDGKDAVCVAGNSGIVDLSRYLDDSKQTHTIRVGVPADWMSHISVKKLVIEKGKELVALEEKPLIEFIGDSITAGTYTWPEATTSYSYKTSGLLDADYAPVAHGSIALVDGANGDRGEAVFTKNTAAMNKRYFKTKPWDSHTDNEDWNFSAYTPDLVVINLGSNDIWSIGAGITNEQFEDVYVKFVQDIREKRGDDVPILMMIPIQGYMKNQITAAHAELNDPNTHLVDATDWLTYVEGSADFADWIHPSDQGSTKVADKLAEEIREILLAASLKAAEDAAEGVQTIDGKTAAEVEKDIKFVTSAEMEALTDAKEATADAVTLQEVLDAKDNLDEAVKTFENAIKTGSYVELDEDTAAAKAVEDQITALPSVDDLALTDKEDVAAAREALGDLTDDQGALVSDAAKDKLEALEDKLDELQAEADLAQAKTEAKAELAAYRAAKADADYRDAQVTELNNAVTAGNAAIDAAATEEAVAEALADAKAALDAVKTDAELDEEEENEKPSWPIYPSYPSVPSTPAKPAKPVKPVKEFTFKDVAKSDWYYDEVKDAFENGLIDGITADSFAPNKELTVAQAIKLAAALHQLDKLGRVNLENGTDVWYNTYVRYAVANEIIDEKYAAYTKAQMNAPISREEFVHIFHGAMEYYAKKNDVADNAIPDVKLGDDYADEIYTFYRAGILTGSDAEGTFHPESSIKRSEVAAILIRMYDTTARQSVTLK